MNEFSYIACALPACSCPTLSVENNIDNIPIVYIVDDQDYVVQMSIEEMRLIAIKFIEEYGRV